MSGEPLTLIYGPHEAGRLFIRKLHRQGKPVAAVVNSERSRRQLQGYGIERFVRMDTRSGDCPLRAGEVGDVYLFDDSVPLTCRYLRLIRPHISGVIVVILQEGGIPALYRHLGADIILRHSSQLEAFCCERDSELNELKELKEATP